MNRNRVLVTILGVGLVVTTGILVVLNVFAPDPLQISLQGFPAALAENEPFPALNNKPVITIANAVGSLKLTCDASPNLGIVVDSEKQTVTWDKPVVGKHSFTFVAEDENGAKAKTTWDVTVSAPSMPRLSLQGFVETLEEGTPFDKGTIIIEDGTPPFSLTCDGADELGIVVDNETRTVVWDQPVTGSHSLTFTVQDKNGNKAQATWEVSVKPSLESAVVDGGTEDEETQPENETSQLNPQEDGTSKLNPQKEEPDDTEDDVPKVTDDQTKSIETQAESVVPPWDPPVQKLSDEIHYRAAGGMKLYGRGTNADPKVPPDGYLLNQLKAGDVVFVYDFTGDEAAVTREIEALLTLGAELCDDTTEPTTVKIENETATAILDTRRRGTMTLRLPVGLWRTVLKTTDEVQVLNQGSVRWRIRPYVPDPGAYVVVIRPEDIKKR